MRRALILRWLLSAFWLIAASAHASTFSLQVEVTPAGVASKWPTNAEWTAAAGNFGFASAPPAISVATGASGSQNARSLLLSDPGTATIGIAGCTLANGFSLGTNGITWSSATAYSQVCRYTALSSLGAFTAQSDLFRVEAIAPAGDTTAPAPVTGFGVANGTGLVTVTADPCSDPYDAGAGTGCAYLDIRHSVDGTISVPIAAGLSKQLTTVNIGSGTGTNTCTQSGVNWTLVGAGTGMDSTADGILSCTTDVVFGSVIMATVKVTSITNAATYNKAGLDIRATTDANSAGIGCYILRTGSTYKFEMRRRASTGTSRGNLASATLTGSGPYWVQYRRDSGGSDCSYSYDGLTWTTPVADSTVVTFPSTFYVGLFATATSAGTSTTAALDNFSLTNYDRISYDYPTIHSGTIDTRFRDVSANASSYTSTLAVAPTVPADVTAPVISVQPTCSASGSASSITCTTGTWTDSGTIRGYIPTTYTGSTCAAGTTTLAEQTATSYTATGLTSNTAYSYKFQAIDTASNLSAMSNCVTATTASSATDPAAAPAGLAVAVLGTTSLRPSWNAATNAHHYRVRYKLTSACSTCWTVSAQLTALTMDLTGLQSGTSYDVQVGSFNSSESVFFYSSTVQATTTAVNAGNGFKWHPGVYIGMATNKCDSNSIAEFNGVIDSIANDTLIKGVQIKLSWSCLEGATAGDYSAGFAIVDALISRLANLAVPKRLMLQVLPYAYGTCSQGQDGNPPATGSILIPSYIRNTSGWVDWCYSNRRYVVAIWNSAVADRMIALSAAYAARYDTNARVEMFRFHEETAALSGTSATNYSLSSAETQWKRIIAAQAAQWTHTQVRNPINYFSSDSVNRTFYDTSVRPGMTFGGPDSPPFSTRNISGNRQYIGQTTAGVATWTDLKDSSPWVAEIQFGTAIYGTQTLQQLYDNAYSVFHPEYFVWFTNAWDGVTGRYTAPMLAFVRAGSSPVYSTACPTGWTCDTN